jgi:hypothetical protein
VVARRECDDPRRTLRGVEPGEPVVGAAELEGARVLQGLELEQDAPARAFVERRRREQWRAARVAGEACGRLAHVREAGQPGPDFSGH